MQYTQQVIFPVQVAESLLHDTGERLVLDVLQREDVLPLERKKKKENAKHHFEMNTFEQLEFCLFLFFFILL